MAETDSTPAPPNLVVGMIRLLVVLIFCGGITIGLLYGAANDTWPESSSLGCMNQSTILFITALVAYGVNWIVFVPAAIAQTEKYYDFTGSVTYFSATIISLLLGAGVSCSDVGVSFHPRAVLQSFFVLIWCVRLGSFLFARIKKDGKDGRFDEIKINPPRFLGAWTIQGAWVFFTALPVFLVNSSGSDKAICANDVIGWLVWAFGFAIEVIADNQKGAFAANPANKGKYINEGLWYYSRHPNYFGEMTLWFCQFIAATAVMEGSQYCTIFSPFFVIFLLMKVSGVPMLEKRGEEKFKGDTGYALYVLNTSCIIPLPKGTKTEVPQEKLLQEQTQVNTV